MRLVVRLAAVVGATVVGGGCASLPPYSPMTSSRETDWQDCRQQSLRAAAKAGSESGVGVIGVLTGPIGAVVANQATGFSFDAFIDKCMADKGYTLPPGFTGTRG